MSMYDPQPVQIREAMVQNGVTVETKRKQRLSMKQPKGTIEYTVSGQDTLASIAAQFDTTPSELKKLNRLMSTVIFLGQKVYVPDKDYTSSGSATPQTSPTDGDKALVHSERGARPTLSTTHAKSAEMDILEAVRAPQSPTSPHASVSPPGGKGPGLAERVTTGEGNNMGTGASQRISGSDVDFLDKECVERFLKVSVKHITDGMGVVNGVLLVTPNAVMFDPNVSEPLVVEHGADIYGMIAPMDTIISAAIYHDIAAMKLKHAPRDEATPKPEVYHAKHCPLYRTWSDERGETGTSTTKPDTQQPDQAVDLVSAPTVTNQTSPPDPGGQTDADSVLEPRVPRSESIPKVERVPRSESICSCGAGLIPDTDVFHYETEQQEPSQEHQEREPAGLPDLVLGLENVSVRDSDSKVTSHSQQASSELIPKPARQFEDPPLYLCLRVGVPINKTVSKTCPIESYSRKKKQPEYWFSVPRDKVDHLYAFFIQWSPSIYGDDEEIDARARGFVVIDETDELDELEASGSHGSHDSSFDLVENHYHREPGRLPRQISKDWEIVSCEEARRRLSILEEENLPLPDLLDESTLIGEEHIRKLSKKMPARCEGYPWSLVYSSDKHGFSLKTLYRACLKIDSPLLLCVKDTSDHIFGALLSCAVRHSDHFYGTGESFLYTFHPEFRIFVWSGSNNFFIKGNLDSLSVGAGEGSFGLWLDGDLYHGRTQACQTFNNDLLTDTEDFMIKGVEAWAFV